MSLWDIFLWVYCGIVCLAFLMTLREQRRTRNKTLPFMLLGYVVCAFWPMILVVGLALRGRPAES